MPEKFGHGDLCFIGYCDTCEHEPIARLSDDAENLGDGGQYQPCDACEKLLKSVGMWRQAADKVPHPYQLNREGVA